MRILCMGISHKTAPVAMRELLAFDRAGLDKALSLLRQRWPEAEFLLLSTCNRTELYVARPLHSHPREEELLAWLADFHSQGTSQFRRAVYHHADAEAAGQLFRVAAGLDSLVLGEAQIVQQIKSALASAQQACASGQAIRSLVSAALHTAKHVRSETGIGSGKVSIASAAIKFIEQQLGSLAGRCVLSVGAGKMNELMLRQISTLKPARVLLANRSPARAEQLAEGANCQAVALEELGQHLGQADVVVASTGSPEAIISADMLRQALASRADRPMLLIDLAVPRDIAPAAGDLPNVTLCDIDALQDVVDRTAQDRAGHVSQAQRIVAEHVAEFVDGLNSRQVAPTIEALYRRVETIIAEELAEAGNKLSTHADAEEDLQGVQRSLRRAMRKLCHPAAENLRQEAATGPGGVHAEIVRKLFELDE